MLYRSPPNRRVNTPSATAPGDTLTILPFRHVDAAMRLRLPAVMVTFSTNFVQIAIMQCVVVY